MTGTSPTSEARARRARLLFFAAAVSFAYALGRLIGIREASGDLTGREALISLAPTLIVLLLAVAALRSLRE